MWKLVLLFTLLPALELFLLLQIGSAVGVLPTVGIILLTGLTGGWLAKREGLRVLQDLMASLQQGMPPAPVAGGTPAVAGGTPAVAGGTPSKLVEGGLVFAGGLLLVTPGVVTDLAGFAFIFAPTRRLLAPYVLRWLAKRFTVHTNMRFDAGGFSATGGPAPEPRRTTGKLDESLFDHPFRESPVSNDDLNSLPYEDDALEAQANAFLAALEAKNAGRIDEAEDQLRDILKAEPRLAEPRMELARILLDTDRLDAAEAEAREALDQIAASGPWTQDLPDNVVHGLAHALLAEILRRRADEDDVIFGDPDRFRAIVDESREHFDLAAKLDPSDEYASYHAFFLGAGLQKSTEVDN